MRSFSIGTLGAYAQAKGMSINVARRLAREDRLPGANKVNGRWYVPVTNQELKRGGNKMSVRTIKGMDRNDLVVQAAMPSNIDGRGSLPDSEYRKSKNSLPLGKRYSYQFVAIVRMKSSGDVIYLRTESVMSSSKVDRATLRREGVKEFNYKYGGSPFEILWMGAIARDHQQPKPKKVRPKRPPLVKSTPAKPKLRKLKRNKTSSKPKRR